MALPSAASAEEARRPLSPGDTSQLLPRRRPPFPAVLPASQAAPPPLSGFAAPRGYGRPRPRPDSRYGGGGRRAAAAAALLLIASSPPSQQATPPGPACPSHLQRTLGTDRACALGEEATLWRTQCWRPSPPLQQPLTAPQGRRRALGPNSRGSARPLGPALIIPGRGRSPTPSMRAAKPAQAPARRGGAETRGPSRGSLSPGHLLGARSRQTT